jgi:hypothetical protein
VKIARPVRDAGRRNGPVERPAPRRCPARTRTELVLDALERATWSRTCYGITDLSGLVCHDDARSHYASIAFTERLAAGARTGNGRRRAWIVPWSRRGSAAQSELIRRRRLLRHFGEVERPLWNSRHSESPDSPVVAP